MREPHEIIIAPVVTEKSAGQVESDNVYTFLVAKDANKIEIGKAVERIWDVAVKDVRTMTYGGKARRSFMGRMAKNWSKGRRPGFKKAVVQIGEGDHIEFYEVG